jgi:hypothetical protein
VADNRHRHRVHTLDLPAELDALRLVVVSTNGAETAQVVALRVFAPRDS